MPYALFKLALTAVLIVAISELSKRSTMMGALLASIPLTSVLAMTWLYVDTGEIDKVAALSTSVFWLVLPSLALFLALPALLRAGVGFWPSMVASMVITAACYAVMVPVLTRFGISL